MPTYIVIDINGDTHEISADGAQADKEIVQFANFPKVQGEPHELVAAFPGYLHFYKK